MVICCSKTDKAGVQFPIKEVSIFFELNDDIYGIVVSLTGMKTKLDWEELTSIKQLELS